MAFNESSSSISSPRTTAGQCNDDRRQNRSQVRLWLVVNGFQRVVVAELLRRTITCPRSLCASGSSRSRCRQREERTGRFLADLCCKPDSGLEAPAAMVALPLLNASTPFRRSDIPHHETGRQDLSVWLRLILRNVVLLSSTRFLLRLVFFVELDIHLFNNLRLLDQLRIFVIIL